MTQDQLLAMLRSVITAASTSVGTWLVAKGYVSADQWSSILGFFLATVLPLGLNWAWSWAAHSPVGRLNAVSRIPDVVAVTTAPTPQGTALATAVVSNKVQPGVVK